MGSRTQQAVADRIYEDFEPFYEWDRGQRLVNVMLPGYRRDQLKVQVTSKRVLRIMGERLVFENRWRRFNLELPLLSDYDTDNVSAKFEGGTLSVKFGKLLKPEETTTTATPTQKVEEQKPPHQAEEAKKTNAEVSDRKKEETKTETTEKVSEEAKTNNGSSEKKEAAATATTPQAPPTTKTGKSVARSKTRLIDFSLSLGSNRDAIGDSDAGKNKYKNMVKWMLIIYLVLALVGLGFYYARNELTLSPGESDIESYFQEL